MKHGLRSKNHAGAAFKTSLHHVLFQLFTVRFVRS